jgi:signal recognition particle subunit SRP54
MFDSLSNSLQRIFRNLRGHGKLTEANVKDTMREVRMALIEADVNYRVAQDFIGRVRDRCLGQEVLDSITPGQQVIKRVHEEMIALLGGARREVDLSRRPATVMLVGLHGSGKTTTAAKLAALWKKAGRNVLLVAADTRRPAAVQQLTILAGQVGVDIVTPQPGEAVPGLGLRALDRASGEGRDVVLLDTGGRLQIDSDLVAELKELRESTRAHNVILVVDAAIGQESVNVAGTFHREVGLTGLILTKLDGDARGGAALSIQAVTGCPILYTGTGERIGDLEPFHPERMASRILGMGDVISLVEKAQESIDMAKAAEMERKLKTDSLTLEDFLEQMEQMKKMGPLENLLEMLPGGGNVAARMKGAAPSGTELADFTKKATAVIQSMTPQERRHPETINGSRRRRIAKGSGTQPSDVNDLLRQFQQARKMAKQLKRMGKRLQMFR